jgi:hypothetical protein
MTPRPSSQPGEAHLTAEQLDELLVCPAGASELTPAEAHLLACEQCAAELASLRESLFLFRQATSTYADRQLRLLPRWRIPLRAHVLQPAYFAAAAILLISLVPMQMAHRRDALHHPAASTMAPVAVSNGDQARTAESDNALLEDVYTEVSASVPTPMQALDNPIASADSDESIPTSTQRKD